MEDEIELCPYCKHVIQLFKVEGKWYAYCEKLDDLVEIRGECPWYELEEEEEGELEEEWEEEL